MNSPIPMSVVYAGLAGTLLALIIATAQQKWSTKVFFLLALRLAIGWQFMFEGLHKIHSTYMGPTETSRPFTSEPYFKLAPGPIGEKMRNNFGDPNLVIAAKVKAPKDIKPEAFDKLSAAEQAAECPPAVAQLLDAVAEQAPAAVEAMKADSAKQLADADAEEKKAIKAANDQETEGLKTATTDLEKKLVKDKAEEARSDAKKKAADKRKAAQALGSLYPDGPSLVTAAKATYARWVYGVEGRDCKVKAVTGDAALTAPDRLKHLEWLRQELKTAQAQQGAGLGNGYGTDVKRVAECRMDLVMAESDLARDASAFVAELQQAVNGKPVEETTPESMGKKLDKFTMWFLVVVGALLMGGLFTRLACVAAAGFLVMTYLAFPPFPWYPVAPNTEGNPLFINKNMIECIALLALACMPTGRWMGIDALIHRVICGKEQPETPPTPATKTA
ncbi:MAG: hypothetical protein K8U57_16895 [Planctomycetes bacterium]|nr:hypothetical protein [Planctomycetota bacterium]